MANWLKRLWGDPGREREGRGRESRETSCNRSTELATPVSLRGERWRDRHPADSPRRSRPKDRKVGLERLEERMLLAVIPPVTGDDGAFTVPINATGGQQDDQSNPTIVINPINANKMVMVYQDVDPFSGALEVEVRYSNDGGANWNSLGNQPRPTDPATIATRPPAMKAVRMKSYSNIVAMGVSFDQPVSRHHQDTAVYAQHFDGRPVKTRKHLAGYHLVNRAEGRPTLAEVEDAIHGIEQRV